MTSKVSDILILSIVSHGHGSLIKDLLQDLNFLRSGSIEVIITLNIPEDESFLFEVDFPVLVIRNSVPKGFGANHNEAFKLSNGKWFAVVNPDIRLRFLDIQVLLSPFLMSKVMVVAPLVLSLDGDVEDSARRFPTLWRLWKRVFLGLRISDYKVKESPYVVDWVAGMFMVFRPDAFIDVRGFDERRFYMYLEDADICKRISLKGGEIVLNPNSQVIHIARRESHRSLTHLRWHIVSAFRFLTGL